MDENTKRKIEYSAKMREFKAKDRHYMKMLGMVERFVSVIVILSLYFAGGFEVSAVVALCFVVCELIAIKCNLDS